MSTNKYISLLDKDRPLTGEEVGKLLLYNETEELKAVLKNGLRVSVLPKEKMQERINALNDTANLTAFNNYVGINNFIRYAYNTCLGHRELVRNRLSAIETSIIDIAGFANRVRLFNKLPEIVTMKQFEEMYYNDEELKTWTYGLDELVAAFLAEAKARYDIGKADTKFNNIMEKYKSTPIPQGLKPFVNKIWCENEIFFIENSPDIMATKKDFINALRYRNIKPLKEYSEKELAEPLTYDYIKALMPEEELKQVKVHREENETDKIKTLFDFVDSIKYVDVHELTEGDITPKDVIEPYLRELYKYGVDKVVTHPKLSTKFKQTLSERALSEVQVTLPELAHNEVLNFKDFLIRKYQEKHGVGRRGIAVIYSGINESEIDSNGYYRCSQPGITYDELLNLITAIKDSRVDNEPIYKEHFLWVAAHNLIIEEMAKAYKMEDLTVFKIDMSDIYEIIKRINERITDMLLYKFSPIDMGHINNAAAKLEKIREDFLTVFPFINGLEFNPKEEDLAKAVNYINNPGNFYSLSPSMELYYILFGVRS